MPNPGLGNVRNVAFVIISLALWDCRVHNLFEGRVAFNPGARRREGCRICHNLLWTKSMKLSLLFSILDAVFPKVSVIRLFKFQVYS